MSRRRVATFEEPVKKGSGNQGFVDLFWKGMLLMKYKSQCKYLEKAFKQAQGNMSMVAEPKEKYGV